MGRLVSVRNLSAFIYTGIQLGIFSVSAYAQNPPDTASVFTLDASVRYALGHQPFVRQSDLDVEINTQDIRLSLSGWLPQVSASANLQHYAQLPTVFIPDPNHPEGPKLEYTSGVLNNSTIGLSVNQTIYNNELLFAAKAVRDLRLQASQGNENTRINTVVEVSKAFYDVLLTKEQSGVLEEDIQRLKRSYGDALELYKTGLTDKTDFQQALILLNNANADIKISDESYIAKIAALKQAMGYPADKPLRVQFDSASLEKEAFADTLEQLNVMNRIEVQQMETDLRLQNIEVKYYRWSFLPTLSAFYNYNFVYQNDQFGQLYNLNYPNSLLGLQLNLPIFQGTSRIQNLRKAGLQYKRLEAGMDYLKSQIHTEYSQALGAYKSSLYALVQAKSNNDLAFEIYNTVRLQYTQGIKDYLDVLVAETSLRTARLNYLRALFELLSSRLDLKKALGEIVTG
ncbi:MAG TPA: TolC family protein [Bacteroidales bacterium]|nr:TolC family protein [Bacteroidales bacterium]